ncbi:fructose permease [Bifidobacterium sp. DSM 109957]|uniref:Fructose permease n=2 Tax=Bifidobacterium oedipodis TaxID=2675322 RepID=A0A7Y0EQT2_9BIFI|nr:fructose permease [Bifidobacterium sp. DSM 109957]
MTSQPKQLIGDVEPDRRDNGTAVGKRTAPMGLTISLFLLSLPLNALGNVLTAVTSNRVAGPDATASYLGAAFWTAGEYNMADVFPSWMNVGGICNVQFWSFFLVGLVVIAVNQLLVGRVNWLRILGNLAFLVPFSLLVGVFTDLLLGVFTPGWNGLPYAGDSMALHLLYIALNFGGVALIAVAISLYQRANIALHPADDLMQILRFKFCKGNAARAMWLSYLPPALVAIAAIAILSVRAGGLTVNYFGVGTVFAFLFQGGITGWADRHVIPSFTHQALDVGSVAGAAADRVSQVAQHTIEFIEPVEPVEPQRAAMPDA